MVSLPLRIDEDRSASLLLSSPLMSITKDVLVLAPLGDGPATMAAGLSRLGCSVRIVRFDEPGAASRLTDARPNMMLIWATTTTTERAALSLLEAVTENLRSMSVPLLVAIGSPSRGLSDLVDIADDVLLPPHDPLEAVFRAALVSKRQGGGARLVTIGPLTVDVEGFRAWLSGNPVSLTYTEFQLLRLLVLNRGSVLTRQMLLNKIWGYDYLGGLRTVDVHIRRLRSKIEGEAPNLIETVRNVGYRIAD